MEHQRTLIALIALIFSIGISITCFQINQDLYSMEYPDDIGKINFVLPTYTNMTISGIVMDKEVYPQVTLSDGSTLEAMYKIEVGINHTVAPIDWANGTITTTVLYKTPIWVPNDLLYDKVIIGNTYNFFVSFGSDDTNFLISVS